MTKEQYLLGKLAEECIELAKVALKTQQLGAEFRKPYQDMTNLDNLRIEYNHVAASIKMLNAECGYEIRVNEQCIDYKISRVHEWMTVSEAEGRLDLD